MSKPTECRLAQQFLKRHDLVSRGLRVEPLGRHAVRLSLKGRSLGLWRQAVGSYVWLPADATGPSHQTPTAEEAVQLTARYMQQPREA
jgi:hypothetical protein